MQYKIHTSPIRPKRALISVSDKTGIVEFAAKLHSLDIEIISTGGTAKTLRENGVPVQEISDYTKFPEIMGGRVKTLHPFIHGGILGRRDVDEEVARLQGIQWIDLVICNLYPFEKATHATECTEEFAIENIDIGGPSMIRSAAKNYSWVTVVVQNSDQTSVLAEIEQGGISLETRKKLAVKAFAHTAAYDSAIYQYFSAEKFPPTYITVSKKVEDLRYGENPHQQAAFYTPNGAFPFLQHQGKQLSYNNLLDVDAAWGTVAEFNEPTCVIIKHGNPCGVASAASCQEAYMKALSGDPASAFGGIVAFNMPVSKTCAELIVQTFYEIIIAPSFEDGALPLFTQKKNLRILTMAQSKMSKLNSRSVIGGILIQDVDMSTITSDSLSVGTLQKPTAEQLEDLLFAYKAVKHVKSNAIVLAKDSQLVGLGSGHVSRIDSVECAVRKAGAKARGAVLASDAFFPFRDSIDRIAELGISAIIQPGGSIKDAEVIAACNEHKLPMVFTGVRVFKH